MAIRGGRHDPGSNGALVVEVGRHGGLDEAPPARRERPWVVEELEGDQCPGARWVIRAARPAGRNPSELP
jgi:hypothetical protein